MGGFGEGSRAEKLRHEVITCGYGCVLRWIRERGAGGEAFDSGIEIAVVKEGHTATSDTRCWRLDSMQCGAPTIIGPLGREVTKVHEEASGLGLHIHPITSR